MNMCEKKQRYLKYLEDIKIAQKRIRDMKLYPDKNVLCDLYAIPSLNFQSYYALIYEHGEYYEMVYAKPLIYASNYSDPIRMYSFANALKAEKAPDASGQIIIGMRQVPEKLLHMLCRAIESLSAECILEDDLTIIENEDFAFDLSQKMIEKRES